MALGIVSILAGEPRVGKIPPAASIATKWILITILWSVVAIRFWAIRKLTYTIWSPRGLASICILTLTFLGTFYCISATYLIVRIIHIRGLSSNEDIPEELAKPLLVVSSSAYLAYLVALWLVKTAFVVSYCEFADTLPFKRRWILYGTAVSIFVSFVYVLTVNMLWCLPVTRRWSVGHDYCNSFISINPVLQTTVANIATDILLCAAAYLIISSIKFQQAQAYKSRRAVWFMVGISSMTILVAIARLLAILLYYKWYDTTSSGIIELLTEIEAVMAGCAACLPAMRVFVRKQRDTSIAKRKSMITQSSDL